MQTRNVREASDQRMMIGKEAVVKASVLRPLLSQRQQRGEKPSCTFGCPPKFPFPFVYNNKRKNQGGVGGSTGRGKGRNHTKTRNNNIFNSKHISSSVPPPPPPPAPAGGKGGFRLVRARHFETDQRKSPRPPPAGGAKLRGADGLGLGGGRLEKPTGAEMGGGGMRSEVSVTACTSSAPRSAADPSVGCLSRCFPAPVPSSAAIT